MMCRKFKAVDEHTLENDYSCCLGVVPVCNKGEEFHYTRDPEGIPPNSFSNANGTIEFGGCNGLCAASSNSIICDLIGDVCYLRVC